MSFARGFFAPFRGIAFVARQGLWSYLLLPLLLGAALAGASGWLGVRLVLGASLALLAGLVVGLLVFVALQPVVNAPFVDLLTERVEAVVLGRPGPSQGLLPGALQALGHGLQKALLYLLALAVTALLGALTGAGSALGLLLYGAFLAFDGFDYPLARRGASFSAKWGYLRARAGLAAGYAAGAGLLLLVPLAGLVAPTFAAVGATIAYLEEEDPPPAGARGTRK
jgi:CysZ protein